MASPCTGHQLLLLVFIFVMSNGQGIEADALLEENVEAIFNAVVTGYCQAEGSAAAKEAQTKQVVRDVLKAEKESCQPSVGRGSLAVTHGPCVDVSTVNLSEWWRKDSLGSAIKPIFGGYACDRPLQDGTRWFRFTGDAGDQLSNSCRPDFSCGGHGGFWSDAEMPTQVGEIRKVPIYGSFSRNCKRYIWPERNAMTVQRCSDKPGDFVYKVKGTQSCYWTFCGMNA